MLCVSMTAMADENGVLIDGVYYNLQNNWCYYYYDEWYNLYARWHSLTGRTQTWRTNIL